MRIRITVVVSGVARKIIGMNSQLPSGALVDINFFWQNEIRNSKREKEKCRYELETAHGKKSKRIKYYGDLRGT